MQRVFVYAVLLKAGTTLGTVHVDLNYSYVSDAPDGFNDVLDSDNQPLTDFESPHKAIDSVTDRVKSHILTQHMITVASNEIIVEDFS